MTKFRCINPGDFLKLTENEVHHIKRSKARTPIVTVVDKQISKALSIPGSISSSSRSTYVRACVCVCVSVVTLVIISTV